MFLEKINQYPNESQRLRLLYSNSCPHCNNEGVITTPNGYKPCECVRNANVHARLLCNGMPRKYLNKEINQLTDLDPNVISKLNDFCSVTETGINSYDLFINGMDKIKIMETICAVSNDLAFKKNPFNKFYNNILIVTVEDLMQTLYLYKNNIEQKNKIQKIINNVDILVLNYLGEETDSRTEQTAKYLNDLIVQRSFNEKVNILSSSLNLEEIANKYGIYFITTIKNGFKPIKLTNANINNGNEDDQNGYY